MALYYVYERKGAHIYENCSALVAMELLASRYFASLQNLASRSLASLSDNRHGPPRIPVLAL